MVAAWLSLTWIEPSEPVPTPFRVTLRLPTVSICSTVPPVREASVIAMVESSLWPVRVRAPPLMVSWAAASMVREASVAAPLP